MPAPAEKLDIRRGDDADIPAAIELMKTSLGEGTVPRTREFWLWKHRENPAGTSPMWLAHSAGKLVGLRLFMRWQLRAGGRDYSAVRAVDTATHPDFQGRGIFKQLTLGLVEEERGVGTHLVFNTPNDKSRPGYLKMGWQSAGKVSLWVRPQRPLRLLGATLQRVSASQALPPLEHSTTSNLVWDEQAIALLRLGDTQRFHTPITPAYLAWRYRAPGIDYGVIAEGAPDVLVFFRLRRRGALLELRLCDVLVSRRTIRGGRALARCLSRLAEVYQPDLLIASLRPELASLLPLGLAGFVPAPRLGPILTVRSLNSTDGAPDPARLSSWSASIGDLELF